MPKDPRIKKVLVIGSGPIIIGQAAEFDYSGTQACRALKAEGIETVLLNSNPATIMTDPDVADHVYIEPMTLEVVERILEIEKPDSVLPNLGGQMGLNLSMELARSGYLDRTGIRLLACKPETIDRAEDRELFKETMEKLHQPIIPSEVVETLQDALACADRIGYPVVMKMTSKTTSHKTDVGGVRVNIGSAEALRAEYRDLVAKLDERGLLDGLEGVIIQEMVKGSREMVCGIATDPQYGPMLMFGLGGVFVEVMKDVAFRIAPVTDTDARDMVRSVKAYKLLQGARGTTPADIAKVEETLLRLSQLVTDLPFIDELDINPLMISEKTGEPIAVDGRIKVRRCEAESALA